MTNIEKSLTAIEWASFTSISGCIQNNQAYYGLDSVSYAAILGRALGEMLAAADAGSEERMKLEGDLLEPLKKTFLLNFDAAYNQARSELVPAIKPKKGPI